jgi:hypothetical protein
MFSLCKAGSQTGLQDGPHYRKWYSAKKLNRFLNIQQDLKARHKDFIFEILSYQEVLSSNWFLSFFISS